MLKDIYDVEVEVGKDYHAVWQRTIGKLFYLEALTMDKKRCMLVTRKTRRFFWTSINDLRDVNEEK